jgi:hypothetical protein
MIDRAPQPIMLSTNDCPNSGPDSIFGNDCTPGALTMWGYCGQCWLFPESRIPAHWHVRLDREGCITC